MALFSGRLVVPAPGCSCGISLNLGCCKVGVRAGRPRTIFGRAPGSRQEWTDRVRTRPASAARSRPVPRGCRPPALRPSPPGSPRRYRKSWNQIVSVGPALSLSFQNFGPLQTSASPQDPARLAHRLPVLRSALRSVPAPARGEFPPPRARLAPAVAVHAPLPAPVPPSHPRGGLARILSDLAPSALILMLI